MYHEVISIARSSASELGPRLFTGKVRFVEIDVFARMSVSVPTLFCYEFLIIHGRK
jgi:hypothetical protein